MTPVRADELPWQDDYNRALAEAKAAHKTVLLDFSASWCGPCRLMETTTFTDRNVQSALAALTLVKIDIDRDPTLSAQYKVQAIPTCIILNQFGELVDRRTGYADAEVFSMWIKAGETSAVAQAKEPKSQEVARVVKELGQTMELPDPAARRQAMLNLLTIYCAPAVHHDSAADPQDDGTPASPPPAGDGGGERLVEAELADLVKRHPGWVAPYLNEPRLAVRILLATLFAANAGADFHFDPWAPSEERARLAETWTRHWEDR